MLQQMHTLHGERIGSVGLIKVEDNAVAGSTSANQGEEDEVYVARVDPQFCTTGYVHRYYVQNSLNKQ